MNLFTVERSDGLLEGIDSMTMEDSLKAFVNVEKLTEILSSSTQTKYISNFQKSIKEKYYFEIDLKNIDSSLSKTGMSRTSIPYKKKVFSFTPEKNK